MHKKVSGGRCWEEQDEEEERCRVPGGTGRGGIPAERSTTTGIVLSPEKAACGNCRDPAGIFKADPARIYRLAAGSTALVLRNGLQPTHQRFCFPYPFE